MNNPKLSNMFRSAQISLSKHSPEILTGFGIAGMITATVLAVKATPKAIRIIETEKRHRDKEYYDERLREWCGTPFTPIEYVQLTWKCYIPTAITTAVSVACLVGASSVNARRNAVLATAYNLSATALSEYKDKVVETIGEKKEQTVVDKVAKEKIDKHPVANSEVIVTKKGTTLCYDGVFGRYFKSDMDIIKKAINKINRDILTDMYASLNDFYSEIDLDPVDIGYDLGWNLDHGPIDVNFSSQLTEDGTPCLVMSYNVAPKYKFSSLT